MNKSLKVLFVGLLVFLIGFVVSAKEDRKIYYVNDNGVELTQYEYVFLQNFYFDSFPEHITQEQYNILIENDTFNGTVTKVTYEEPGDRAGVHTTPHKTLSIAKSCSTNCTVNLQNYWTSSPSIRSYDDIGVYYIGNSILSHLFTSASSTTSYQTFNSIKTGSNGYGNTVKLPDTGTNVTITMSLIMSSGGTVYGSYQHAMCNTTFNVAQDYTFSLGGFGHVFAFGNSAINVYDGMGGVDLYV